MTVSGNVVLTGASGFIGSHLRSRLAKLPHVRLVLIGRRPPGQLRSNELFIERDLESLDATAFQRYGIESLAAVFHFGAFTPKNAAQADDAQSIFGANVCGTRRLLEALPCDPDVFVFASTLDVYGRTESRLTERSQLEPISLYGASKLYGEYDVRAHCKRRNIRCAVLRFGHIYGPGEGAYEKLIPKTIALLLCGERPMLAGDGSATRDFLYVGDAVEATMRAAFACDRSIDAVNIVSGTSRTLRETVEALKRATRSSAEIRYTDAAAGASVAFDNRFMQQTLGSWEFESFEGGIEKEVADARRSR